MVEQTKSRTVVSLIFSKDRPLQLHTLLSQLKTHSPFLYDCSAILYKASNPLFSSAYQSLSQMHPTLHWVEEVCFSDQLNSLMTARFVAFFVDDCVVVRDIDAEALLKEFDTVYRGECLGISLRLGPDLEEYTEGDLKNGLLDWRLASSAEWRYPMEVSSSIYPTWIVKSLIGDDIIPNPNILEAKLFSKVLGRHDLPKYLRVLPESAAYCIPLNSVQTSPWVNAYCQLKGYDPETLLSRFEKGEYLENIPVEHRGCHWIPTEDDVPL